jgi:O-antigen/teichoic acid export membrane protein
LRDHETADRLSRPAAPAADRPGLLAQAAAGRLAKRLRFLGADGVGRSVAATAAFNIAVTAAGALSGVIIARVTGPTVRGEYSAVTSWFGLALIIGELGQPIALCFYVAKEPQRARAYVATSRTMMIATGAVAVMVGILVAPVLGRGLPGLTTAYRIAFAGLLVSCVGDSYTFGLMGHALRLWNRVRVSQPLTALAAIVVLWRLRVLSLDAALLVLLGSLLVQLGWSYLACRRTQLVPGRFDARLVRPLLGYGSAQIVAVAPATVNAYLDQLVLSVAVSPADLGRYSIAVSMTLLPAPFVSAIGYVLFPRLAAQGALTADTHQLLRTAVLVSAGLAAVILLPLAVAAPWLVPWVFGPAYRGAIPLVWLLTPGGIFLSCGQVVANLLRGRKRQLAVARAEGVAVIFTLALLAALVPIIGVTGAAIASTIPYAISLVLMLRCLWKLPYETDGGKL